MAYTVSYDGSAIDLKCLGGYVYIDTRVIAHLDGSDRISGKYFKNHSIIDVVTDFDVHIVPELEDDGRAFSRRVWPDR